jgi:hypothetical protein
MKRHFSWQKLRRIGESYLSVLPILLTITVLYFTGVIPSFTLQSYLTFVFFSVVIGFGLWLFGIGADLSISMIGTLMGKSLFRHRNLLLICFLTFVLGVIITIAEPDLKIMASQTGWNETLLIAVVSIGVGIFFLIGVLRILFKKNLQVIFLACYALMFSLTGMINPRFLPLAFDSGAVVTGPLTIPFILSFGAALALTRSDSSSHSGEDAFGLTALVTAGPILSVLILALFFKDTELTYTWDPSPLLSVDSWDAYFPLLGNLVGQALVSNLRDLAIAIGPLALFFEIYNLCFLHLKGKELLKILVGFIYAYLGLVLFLCAVNIGFLPVGQKIGFEVGNASSLYPLALALAALFGIFGVLAEPAVHVLVKQIQDVSEGTIKAKSVLAVMALSVGGGIMLQIVRAHYGFSILYYYIPMYALALGLAFVVPKIYANIAFDSGSIASGPMAASFVMPFVVGFTYASHGADAVFASAFGTISMVSTMPLIVIQLLGLYAEGKRALIYHRVRQRFIEPDDVQVIHFN